MKKDIESREDLEVLMGHFYGIMLKDELLGDIFTQVAKINLEKHLPVLVDFWESIIFHLAKYKGNPMEVHIRLHEKHPLEEIHFNRWLHLFNASVDELFEGEKSELAKTRAHSIALMMRHKINTLI